MYQTNVQNVNQKARCRCCCCCCCSCFCACWCCCCREEVSRRVPLPLPRVLLEVSADTPAPWCPPSVGPSRPPAWEQGLLSRRSHVSLTSPHVSRLALVSCFPWPVSSGRSHVSLTLRHVSPTFLSRRSHVSLTSPHVSRTAVAQCQSPPSSGPHGKPQFSLKFNWT
jgi:hypothetical protein